MSRMSHPNIEKLIGFAEDQNSCTTFNFSEDLTTFPNLGNFIDSHYIEVDEMYGLASKVYLIVSNAALNDVSTDAQHHICPSMFALL